MISLMACYETGSLMRVLKLKDYGVTRSVANFVSSVSEIARLSLTALVTEPTLVIASQAGLSEVPLVASVAQIWTH